MSSTGHESPTLHIEARPEGGLIVSGELDLATAPQLRAALERLTTDDGPEQVVLDLSGLRFCDSSGLSVFVQSHQAMRDAGRTLVLDRPTQRLRDLLATTALDNELDVR